MNSWWILMISLGMLTAENLLVDAGPMDMRMFPREREEFERSWLEERRGLCHDMKPIRCILEQSLCDHLNHVNYQDFLAFAYVDCPLTCMMC